MMPSFSKRQTSDLSNPVFPPKSLGAFFQSLIPKIKSSGRTTKKIDIDFGELSEYMEAEICDGEDHPNLKKWDELRLEFNEKTGLVIFLSSYDQDSGDRYDELPDMDKGFYLSLDNVWTYTPEAKKIKDYIEKANWTVFG